jgi:hypothetical protein
MTKLKRDIIAEVVQLPINYPALEYISWFMTDSQNVQNLTSSLFRGGLNTNDPKLVNLLTAANKAVSEVQIDIDNIQTFLNKIIPTAKKIDK